MKPLCVIFWVVALAVIAGLIGCNDNPLIPQPKADAVAVLVPTQGSEAAGVVRLAKVKDGMRIMARISQLTPGDHGFHIHEFGDCRDPDAASAGDHFNPGGRRHGGPESEQHHIGDLGNVTADANGVATFDKVVARIQIDGADSIIGRSIVVHADADDLTSQPAGASGARLACGVIGWAAR
jgi:Cu-Zn family superoxide dismutase